MTSLRVKLLIPTLLTVSLLGLGLSYIIWLEYQRFIEHNEQARMVLRQSVETHLNRAKQDSQRLVDFLGEDWRVQDALLLDDKDSLLDLLLVFNAGLKFDLVAAYDQQGKIIVRADTPSRFGKHDDLQFKVQEVMEDLPKKPSLVLFEQHVLLVHWHRLRKEDIGRDVVLAVGYFLDAAWLENYHQRMPFNLLLEYEQHFFGQAPLEQKQYVTLDLTQEFDTKHSFGLQASERLGKTRAFWDEFGGLIFVLALISLIGVWFSHRFNAQTALSLQNALDNQRETTKALLVAKEGAEQANRAKSAFLANMSHELRTPLNGILGYAQILVRNQNMDEQQRNGVQVIQRSGEHLLTLISDILDLSKIEAERMEIYPNDFHLGQFLGDLVEMFKLRAEQKSLEFRYEVLGDLPEFVHADEKRLRQILINLLGNAVKFTDVGYVSFKVSSNAKSLQFHISDSGVGIAAEDIEHIFSPFHQTGSVLHKAQGTGLGLSITEKLIKHMRGDIRVDSELGQGTQFYFHVQGLEVEGEQTQEDMLLNIGGYRIENQANKRYRILAADDTQANLDVLHNILEPLGFIMHYAENGREAIDIAHAHKPDLIFMDLVMPVLSGFDAIKRLRQQEAFKNTPIITISASVYGEHIAASKEAGSDDFIPKPFRTEHLLQCIAKHLDLTWTTIETDVLEPDSIRVQQHEHIDPSPEQIEKIAHMAEQGDILSLQTYLKQLEQDEPRLQVFIVKVRELANEFEDDAIYELMQKY